MIAGEVKEKYITYDDILNYTNGGYDVYHFYHGSVPKKCKSPFRRDDTPSFGFFHYNGIWLWKDISLDKSGGPIEYVMQRFGLDYKDALNKISWDFGLNKKEFNGISNIITWDSPKSIPEYVHISFSTCKFDKSHAKYWNDYHLSEDYLRGFNVYRVRDLAIKRRKVKLRENELTYVYWDKNIDKCKILRIGVEKENKWRSNVPFNHLWYLDRTNTCDKLMVCKSNKDALVLSLFNLCVCATQSENASCISEENINKINNISEHPYISFGSDIQAKNASIAITGKTKWKHFNMPDKYLETGANDFAEVAKIYGLEAVEKQLKTKKII